MKHFYQGIQGWIRSIPQVYEEQVKKAKDGAHFVEVGAWLGKSTTFMAVEIINSGKDIQFDVVDAWFPVDEYLINAVNKHTKPNQYVKLKKRLANKESTYGIFLENIKPVRSTIGTIYHMKSTRAAEEYEDASLDFVYIDAAHDYDNVIADIKAWLPKVKPGGTLAGHDYGSIGVYRAVNEVFKKEQIKIVNNRTKSWVISV